jgi:tetratricopeptide (TPR) repeat protein
MKAGRRGGLFLASAVLALAQSRLLVHGDDAAKLLPKPVEIPRSYAVVIGISHYKNLPPELQLHFADRDAESMYSILISPEGGNYKAENVHLLIGADATLANIHREIDVWLPQVSNPEDRVLIYFAGHGYIKDGRAYLAPFDLDRGHLAETGYPMETLGHVVGSEIKAKSRIVLTDACHSGALMPETDPAAVNNALKDVHQSVFSLTASRDREASQETPDLEGGHGIFTYFVKKGLEGEADADCDGIVTADELADYVRTNVRKETNGLQTPTSERGSYDPKLLMAYNQSKVCATQPPPQFGALTFVSNMDGVELFVDGTSQGIVNKDAPLKLAGLKPGAHSIKAVKMGYEPDGPRDEIVLPGQESTVTLKIAIRAHRNNRAVEQFDNGVTYYQKGYEANYRKAVECFRQALKLDPHYSEAALFLGRTYGALFQPADAKKQFQAALAIDPDYVEARISYAGLLLDLGDLDESIRQLTAALELDRANPLGLSMRAQALFRKELFADAARSARQAIALREGDPEPHLWLAESLRMAPPAKPPQPVYQEAFSEYVRYLELSDFDSKLAGKLNYYVVGYLIGLGKKKRAAQEDIWKDLRSIAYAGMGDCKRLVGQPEQAVPFYERALHFDPTDPLIHFGLGLAFTGVFDATQRPEVLPPARSHFERMLALNPNLEESARARQYVAKIDSALKQIAAVSTSQSR